MMNDSIRELMDSCRPDDLRQPEMQPLADLVSDDANAAELLARSQQLDAVITEAVHDVPIPAGLEQRLLQAVADAPADSAAGSAATVDSAATPDSQPATATIATTELPADRAGVPDRRRNSASRSWRVWATVATCAAALVLMPLFVNWQPGGEMTSEDLVASAPGWELDDNAWIVGGQMWRKHPLQAKMFTTSVTRRQAIQLPDYGVSASCYELAMPAGSAPGTSARVFVFNLPPRCTLPAAPPRDPLMTRGSCVAAWASGGFAYVLVMNGDENDYQNLISRHSQLAALPRWGANLCPIRTS